MSSPIPLDEQYAPKLKSAREQLTILEERAGVAKAVQRACEGPFFPVHFGSKAAFGSAQHEREREEYLREGRDYARAGIRGAYLSVADVDLRKQLISHHREIERLWAEWQELEAQQRRSALAKLKLGGPSEVSGWVFAAVIAAAISAIGYVAAGLPGTVGSVPVAIFLGKAMQSRVKQEAVGEFAARVRYAESDLAPQEELVERLTVEGPTFSEHEECTGEPDAARR